LSGFDGSRRFEKCVEQRAVGFQFVIPNVNDDDAEIQHAKVLLILKLAIDGHEDIERGLNEAQQGTVFAAAPADLRHGLDVEAQKCRAYSYVHAFV
jgi:hypothetical protein